MIKKPNIVVSYLLTKLIFKRGANSKKLLLIHIQVILFKNVYNIKYKINKE